MKRIYKRTSLVVNKAKKLCRQGGRQMQNYLQQEWDIQLSSKDKRTCHQDVVEKQLRTERSSLLKEKKKLYNQANSLQKQVTALSNQVQKACSGGYMPSRGPAKRKSSSEDTNCHNRGLKKARKNKCSSSLAWLESEGYSVGQIRIVNNSTGKEETIKWNFRDLLGPDENGITESDKNTTSMMKQIQYIRSSIP